MTDQHSIPPPGADSDRQRRSRADAQKLLDRRRRRTWTMRKRVIAGSVAAFAAAWAVIGIQLVSGHDPALGKNAHAAVVSKSPDKTTERSSGASVPDSSSNSSGSSGSSGSSTSSDSTQSSSPADSSQPLAPVTTQQS